MAVKRKIMQILRTLILMFKEKEMVPIMTPTDTEHILDGKVALITGGGSGIGFAIAETFVKSGCKVILAGRKEGNLATRCNQLNNCVPESAKYIVLDVLNVPSMPHKIHEAALLFDKGQIDILVNSAGVFKISSFECATEAEYDIIMDTNVKGTFFMSQAMERYMIDNKIKGHILNVSSSTALDPAYYPYPISKWAVRGFTLGLAQALLPHGIIVNAIAPGPAATPMSGKDEWSNIYRDGTPCNRFIHPAEVASLAVVMASDLGNLIIGDTVYISGGYGTIFHTK